MKFFVVFTAVVAVAFSAPMINPVPTNILQELQNIYQAIQDQILANKPEPVAVGPAIIDFPVPEPAQPIQPSPVVIGPIAPGAPAPLVQIIVNVNDGAAPVEPVFPDRPFPEGVIVDPVVVDPVIVAEPEIPDEPVNVIEEAPVPVEPVVIGTPTIPDAAVVLPEELN